MNWMEIPDIYNPKVANDCDEEEEAMTKKAFLASKDVDDNPKLQKNK